MNFFILNKFLKLSHFRRTEFTFHRYHNFLSNYSSILYVSTRNIRFLRRRPIGIITNDKTKTFEEYVKEEKEQSADFMKQYKKDVKLEENITGLDNKEFQSRFEFNKDDETKRNFESFQNDQKELKKQDINFLFPPDRDVIPESLKNENLHEMTHEEANTLNDPNYEDLLLDDEENYQDSPLGGEKIKTPQKKAKKKKPHREQKDEEDDFDSKNTFQGINIHYYDKTPGTIRSLLQCHSPHSQIDKDAFVLEGWRLIGGAFKAKLTPKAIFFSRSNLLRNLGLDFAPGIKELREMLNKITLVRTPHDIIKLWSQVQTPSGLVGVFPLSSMLGGFVHPEKDFYSKSIYPDRPIHYFPPEPFNTSDPNAIPVVVVLDQIRDPSNLGAILRVCAAVQVQRVILMKGCVDYWNSKVIRSGGGAHWNLCVSTGVSWSEVTSLLPMTKNTDVFLADACSAGAGLSGIQEDDTLVSWERDDNVEDCAKLDNLRQAAIRASTEETVDLDSTLMQEENNSDSEIEEEQKLKKRKHKKKQPKKNVLVDDSLRTLDMSYDNLEHLAMFEDAAVLLPSCSYDYIDMDKTDTPREAENPLRSVIVFGGETGPSLQSVKFSVAKDAWRLFVPIGSPDRIDSLNAATASAVILYEIRRQIDNAKNALDENAQMKVP